MIPLISDHDNCIHHLSDQRFIILTNNLFYLFDPNAKLIYEKPLPSEIDRTGLCGYINLLPDGTLLTLYNEIIIWDLETLTCKEILDIPLHVEQFIITDNGIIFTSVKDQYYFTLYF
jgi:hypothetical protein